MIIKKSETLLKSFWKDNKSILVGIFVLFVVTRLALFSLGLVSQHYVNTLDNQNWRSGLATEHKILSMWAVWDSEWYLKIASRGYELRKPLDVYRFQSINFFPLYPLLMYIVSLLVGSPFIAALLISNLALVIASFLLYKLVASDYEESVARRSLRYFYLSPTAYIFSAVYPESLLVCITLGALLSARYKRWWLAGLFGFFAALTKPVGFIVLIPILYMYFQSVGFSWKNIRFDILNFLLVPLGLICFALYSYFAVGDFFAYIHVHVQSSGYSLSNPLVIMFKSFFQGNIHTIINALAVIIASVVLILGYKKISFGYWLFALALILFGPSMGTTLGSLRYLAIIFPLIIILSLLGRDSENDKGIGSVMALLQGCIFIFWTAGYLFAI